MRARAGLVLAGAAAVAAVAWLAGPLVRPPPEPDPAPPGAPRALRPVDDIPRSPTTFVWTADPEAEAYRFELRGTADTLLWRAVVTDTTLLLPAGTVDWNILAYGKWHVTSLRAGGVEAKGAPAVFRIDSP